MRVDVNKLIDDRKYCESIFKYYLKIKVLKKTDKSFKKHIDKALNNLEFGNFIFSEHEFSIKKKMPGKAFYDWCITIYYYSIYHITLALLMKVGYMSKSHVATISTITLFYYHKDNVLEKEDIKFIIEKISLDKEDLDLMIHSKDLRERACYGTDELFELSLAKDLQKKTADFVNKIRLVLETK